MVRVIGPKDLRDKTAINVTSTSNTWSRELSPMLLGPVEVPGRGLTKTVENAWQYSKVYKNHLDLERNPNKDWTEWSNMGYNKAVSDRYPMGKGAKPEYSYWNGEKLGYIEARHKIYIPIYMAAAYKTEAYKQLEYIYAKEGNITLWDFDGYDHLAQGKTIEECANDPNKIFGHAFVLAMMLNGDAS